MRFFPLSVVLAFAAVFACNSQAQTWTPISSPIYGGRLDKIVADNDGVLYGNLGLFVVRSTDKGLSWTPISPKALLGLDDLSVDARIAIISGPFNVKVVALYPSDGDFTEIYTTFDAGATWTTSQVPDQFRGADLLVVGLKNGTGLAIARSTDGTVALSSSDGGQSWIVETGFMDLPTSVHESTTGSLFVADDNELIRRRTADGTWSTIPLPEAGRPIQNICVAGTRLYLVSLGSVYTSTNEGAVWTSTTFDSPVTASSVPKIVGFPDGGAVLISQYSNIYTAIFRLENDSTVWSTRQDSLPLRIRNPISFGENNLMSTGNAGPIFSDTWGSEWDIRAQGIPFQPILRFAVQGTSIIAVSFNGDIYRGSINGPSWDLITERPPVSNGDFPIRDVTGIAPSTYLASTSRGMFRSDDDGNTWAVVPGTELTQYQLNVCKRRNGSVAVSTRNAIHGSEDLGVTWAPFVTVAGTIILNGIAESANGTLFVAAAKALYRVEGNAIILVHQLSVPAEFAVAAASDPQVYGVVGGSENEGRLEFSVTTNGGSTWTTRELDIPRIEPLVFDAVVTNSGHLFVSYPLGLIHMTPTGTITQEPTTTLGSFSLGLELDADENLLRSGVSIIERNDEPVSVNERLHPIATTVSPMPGRDVVQISGVTSVQSTSLRIINALGSNVREQLVEVYDGVVMVDVRSLSTGAYTVLIGTTGQTASLIVVR